MNIWTIGKNLIKHPYLKRRFLQSIKYEDITDADYMHTKRVCQDFEIKNLGEYDEGSDE